MVSASAQAELVITFANSLDVEDGSDEISTPGELAQWLVGNGLRTSPPPVTEHEHAQCLRLRTGVREALSVDDRRPHILAETDSVLREFPLLLCTTTLLRSGGAHPAHPDSLVPDTELSTVHHALGHIVAALAGLLITGEVNRVKRCPMHDCGWVFWDSSKNHSRRWCSMRVCGNRAKARNFSARHNT